MKKQSISKKMLKKNMKTYNKYDSKEKNIKKKIEKR